LESVILMIVGGTIHFVVVSFGARILPTIASVFLPKKIAAEWFPFADKKYWGWDYDEGLFCTGLGNIFGLIYAPFYIVFYPFIKIYKLFRKK
jgi:hypothetical protein